MNISVFALTKNGAELGERLCRRIDGAYLYLPVRFKGSFNAAFFNDFRNQVGQAFGKSDGLVFIMASGIVVRSIAPFLKNKAEDPAVVVMDEKGRYVISLLSGHLGGANNLAKRYCKDNWRKTCYHNGNGCKQSAVHRGYCGEISPCD